MSPDEQFQAIVKEAIDSANKVECPVEEYIAGLSFMVSEINVAIQAARETAHGEDAR